MEQCSNCGMTLTNPRPPAETAGVFYQSPNYISHTSQSTGIIDRIYLIIRRFTIKWKFNLIKSRLNQLPLLDFGCGVGTFAAYCKSKGVEVIGVEPSNEAWRKASEKIDVFENLNQLPDIKFGVITLWHVLEHVYDLDQTLQKIKGLLADNGTIFIAVPNHESNDAIYYRENWAAFDVPRHVWHFSSKTMKQTLNKNGLRLVNQIPMKLDSYYVCLLSEKNINGGKLTLSKAVKAFFKGYQSNLRAKKNNNYSSIIYQVQK